MASVQEGSPTLGLRGLSLSSTFDKYTYLTTTGNYPAIDPNSSSRAILNAYTPAPKPTPDQRVMEEELQAMLSVLQSIVGDANQLGATQFDEEDPSTETSGEGSLERRIAALHVAPDLLSQLWLSDSHLMVQAAEALADGARDPDWRAPYGEAGIIDFFLTVVKTEGTTRDLMLHSLRLLGNSCADVDENRARIVSQNGTLAILRQLQDASLAPIVIPVLFNICVDYEPAQQQITNNGLAHELIDLVSSPSFIMGGQRDLTSYICRLLELQVALPSGIYTTPENAVEVLLRLASDSNTKTEDFVDLTNLVVSYLATKRFQQRLLAHQTLELVLSTLVDSYGRPFPSEDSQLGSSPVPGSGRELESDLESSLSQMRNTIIQVLSDISAIPEFKETYPLEHTLMSTMRLYWLQASQTQLRICACIVLGNLARSDEACRKMVHDYQLHRPLVKILRDNESTAVVHAAVSFLKNLALMPQNKDILGEAGLVELLSLFWVDDAPPQLQYSAASLLRHVISGSYSNIKRLLSPLSVDPDSPAHFRTYLSILLGLCSHTEQDAIKMEVSRSVTAVSRSLNAPTLPGPQEEVELLLDRFYDLHSNIAWPLGMMVKQSIWPVVKSEGWFAFALMAKTVKGAQAVNLVLTDPEILRPMVETIIGQPISGFQPPRSRSREREMRKLEQEAKERPEEEKRREQEMRRIDRENALVLISKLLENQGNEISRLRKQMFEDLLNGNISDYVSVEHLNEVASEFAHSHFFRPMEYPAEGLPRP